MCIHAGGNRGGGKPPPCIEQTGANVSGIIICKPRHYIPRNTCVSRGVFALPSSFAIEENRGMLPSLSMQPLEANKPRVVIIDWVPLLLLLPVSPGLLSPRSTHPLDSAGRLVEESRSLELHKAVCNDSTPSPPRVPFPRFLNLTREIARF